MPSNFYTMLSINLCDVCLPLGTLDCYLTAIFSRAADVEMIVEIILSDN